MRKIAIAIMVLFIGSAINWPTTVKDVKKKIYEKYAVKWKKTFCFNQKT
jgi:hypothetical protein